FLLPTFLLTQKKSREAAFQGKAPPRPSRKAHNRWAFYHQRQHKKPADSQTKLGYQPVFFWFFSFH
ncbi:MAG: hypothetical protein J6K72_11335, partial [Clostridia bacterium]|nr:hypothetical protein [Clostridia bacterium]